MLQLQLRTPNDPTGVGKVSARAVQIWTEITTITTNCFQIFFTLHHISD